SAHASSRGTSSLRPRHAHVMNNAHCSFVVRITHAQSVTRPRGHLMRRSLLSHSPCYSNSKLAPYRLVQPSIVWRPFPPRILNLFGRVRAMGRGVPLIPDAAHAAPLLHVRAEDGIELHIMKGPFRPHVLAEDALTAHPDFLHHACGCSIAQHTGPLD